MSDNLTFQDEAEAQRVCERWQKILRLQDWIIKIQIVKSNEICEGGALGGIVYYDNSQRVMIKLERSVDVTDGVFGDDGDQEETLVHELLHVMEALRVNDPSEEQKVERCINLVSQALITLDRQARGNPDLSYYRQPAVE